MTCWVPVIQARPAMLGMIAGRPATVVSSTISPLNRDPMIERPAIRSPTAISPRACRTAMRALNPVPQGDRSSLPGLITTAFSPLKAPSSWRSAGAVNWQKDMCRQPGNLRVLEADLPVGRIGKPDTGLNQIPGFTWRQRESKGRRIGDDEAVAAERNINLDGAETGQIERRVEPANKTRDIAGRHPFDLAVTHPRLDAHEPAGAPRG